MVLALCRIQAPFGPAEGFQGVWALKRPVGQAWAQAELDFGGEPGRSLRCGEQGGDTGSQCKFGT